MVHLAGSVLPIVRPAGGVQTRPGYSRKERGLNGEMYRVSEISGETDEYGTTSSGITSPRPPPSAPSVISAHPPPYAS